MVSSFQDGTPGDTEAAGYSPIGGAQSALLNQSKGRLVFMISLFFLGYLAVTLRVFDLTMLQHKSVQEADAGTENVRPLQKPLRGTILDRNGELIATSLKMASVYADATLVDQPRETARALARILTEEDEDALFKKLSSGKKFIWIARNITPRQEYAINALGYPALGFQEEDRRIYPNANLTAHVAGYTDVDGSGISGIEKTYDRQLKEGETPVKLTIDLRIQHVMHRELLESMKKFSAKAAIGMVMDVNTGEIISMVSLPDFDPHYPGQATDDSKFNRDTLGVFEMGSTFKLFSTAAALDAGAVDFGTSFDATTPIRYGRFTISDYHAKKRRMTVPEIFIYSSNIGTAKIAEAVGTGGIRDYYKRFGFMETVPVSFPEKGQPLYPKPWRDISTLTTSFGHGIAVSPLHLMRAASALVNGGIMVKPQLVREEGKSLSLLPVGERVVKPQTSEKIRQLLELVVADGTGANGYVEGYNVGGKTGTAEKTMSGGYNKKSLFSSFLGVFPIQNPRYAVLAIIDEPQGIKETYGYATGGWTAAPVVAKVISQMGPLYQIPPDLDTTHDIEKIMSPYLLTSKGADVASQRSGR